MSITLLLKRGTTTPTPADLQVGEIGINTTNGYAYTKDNSGNIVQIGAGSGGTAAIPTYDNGVTYTVGNQVIYNNRFWFMSTAVGGSGYDPIGYPSYWTEISPASSGAGATAIRIYDPYLSYAVGEQVIYQNRFFLCSSGAGAYANPIDYAYLWTEISPDTVGLTDAPSDNNLYARMNGGWYIVSGGGGGGSWGSITGTLSNQTDLSEALALKAPLESPALTGIPTAPTATSTDESTQIATTAFVHSALAGATVSSTTAVLATVRNETGSTLTAGTVVYISGASGNKALVSKAIATADPTSAGTYGLIQNNINNNNNGTAVIAGIITGLNTDAYPDGTKLYLSPTTAGEWTSTKPSAPDHLVYIGVVTRQHANQGAIQLRIQNGFELEELHNVAISASPNDGDVLTYNTTTELWENQAPSGGGGSGVTLADLGNGDATAGGLVLDALQGSLAPSSTNPMATSGYVTSQINSNNAAIASKLLPAGGTTGQFVKKASNTSYDYTLGNGNGVDIQVFGSSTTSGTFTWTKPAGAKWVEAILWSAGSGGGAGVRNPTTSSRSGGGGGSGGSLVYTRLNPSYLSATETVTVGSGGAGGVAQTANNTNGSAGSLGGDTTFSIWRAQAGTGGNGGTASTASGGTAKNSLMLSAGLSNSNGGAGNISNGTSGSAITGHFYSTTGGGGGAGQGANVLTATAGGAGGQQSTSTTGISITIAGGTQGFANGLPATNGTSALNYMQGATGGGGGYYISGQAGGTGGAGGFPSGGGGGGGASDNGFNSGAGGNGGNGQAIIITYF